MSSPDSTPCFFIGLMSGTSLDGVDGALASFDDQGNLIHTRSVAYVPFSDKLRTELLALQTAGVDEIHREALAANQLVKYYAECVAMLLKQADITADSAVERISAIGVHGQTIRHRPELGYTRQTNHPALLAELTGIDVIADFRSRDIAAGGQGAPLVPAFHRAIFSNPDENRVVVNIGGITNISVLPRQSAQTVIGFDTGPGNVLMDAWNAQHNGTHYDANGAWAKSGCVQDNLLRALRDEEFFTFAPPKSTGRDLFHPAWLAEKLADFLDISSVNVQATLAAFTVNTLSDAIKEYAPDTQAVYICGGGAYNAHLMTLLDSALKQHQPTIKLASTDALGVAPNQVEALAFAWLAQRFAARQAGNLPAVTGAIGPRILGALYPA